MDFRLELNRIRAQSLSGEFATIYYGDYSCKYGCVLSTLDVYNRYFYNKQKDKVIIKRLYKEGEDRWLNDREEFRLQLDLDENLLRKKENYFQLLLTFLSIFLAITYNEFISLIRIYKVKCPLCKNEYNTKGIRNHLKKCIKKKK